VECSVVQLSATTVAIGTFDIGYENRKRNKAMFMA
jgi:hypothetical protein